MPIRFACPSCQQPIEIDDQWAGQSVGCPYCKRVIAAPRESVWPAGEVPMAKPAGPNLAPPPPPFQAALPEGPGVRPVSARGNSARAGLRLALLGGLLWLVGFLSVMVSTMRLVMHEAGPQATMEEVNRKAQEFIQQGRIETSSFTVAVVLLGLLCALAGLVLGARALIRHEHRRGTAVAACIIGGMFTFCEGLFALNLVTSSALRASHVRQSTSVPAADAPRSAPPGDAHSGERT